ncbi:alpha-ketoglutarate-dependent dioxygenase AlkB [Aureispira sp. CCB-QB1]|uniref:alpha-ketoglutarate-dependent dioxygenase AlkB n=1 Tax=Aureispira sp. CCB-QB1 TaxID=1313421 RepID=UPI0006971DE6|nr:alpha-ketoglutarate-dependent dioxygenase AlkB [Aureispira sp. CCB-QB1]
MLNGTSLIPNFVKKPNVLFQTILKNTPWNESIKSRKTASFGLAYNYAPMAYPFQEMLPCISILCQKISIPLQFFPNNCLINLYENGQSKMGYHSDRIDILAPNTGIVIISLGATRILRFRNILNKDQKRDIELLSGSLFYMDQTVQKNWQHSIPKSQTISSRMSLTFRQIIV